MTAEPVTDSAMLALYRAAQEEQSRGVDGPAKAALLRAMMEEAHCEMHK